MSQERQIIRIENRFYATAAVIGMLIPLGFLVWMMVLVLTSGALIPKDEGQLGVFKGVAIGALIGWVILALFFYVATKILFWIELGDRIRYRNLLGVHELPWSAVARLKADDGTETTGVEQFEVLLKRMVGIAGNLVVTTIVGEHFSVSIRSREWGEIVDWVKSRSAALQGRSVRLSVWIAFHFIAVGMAVLAVGLYADYLLYQGTWNDMAAQMRLVQKSKTAWGVIPYALPPLGIALCGYGAYHLFRRRTKLTGQTEKEIKA